MLDRIKVCQWD